MPYIYYLFVYERNNEQNKKDWHQKNLVTSQPGFWVHALSKQTHLYIAFEVEHPFSLSYIWRN